MDVEVLRNRYLHGECMVLAAAMAERTGLPVAGVFTPVWDRVPMHVGISLGAGRYADARGPDLNATSFLDGYDADGEIRPIDTAAMRGIWGHRVAEWTVPDGHFAALGLARIGQSRPKGGPPCRASS